MANVDHHDNSKKGWPRTHPEFANACGADPSLYFLMELREEGYCLPYKHPQQRLPKAFLKRMHIAPDQMLIACRTTAPETPALLPIKKHQEEIQGKMKNTPLLLVTITRLYYIQLSNGKAERIVNAISYRKAFCAVADIQPEEDLTARAGFFERFLELLERVHSNQI